MRSARDAGSAPAALATLHPVQLDALREIANVGAGHAATSLSLMTGRRVNIGVPSVSVAALAAVAEMVAGWADPLTVVRLCTDGALRAGLLMVFPEPAARDLVAMLLPAESAAWPGPLGESALLEVGNVLGGAYLTALAGMTGWSIPHQPPQLLRAPSEQLLRDLSAERPTSNYALCLETMFTVDGEHRPVRGHVLLFPLLAALPALLDVLGLA